jgi:hypothetical protein
MDRHLEKKFFMWPRPKIIYVGLWLASLSANASQYGPVFPTHNFPTDQSFHAVYRYGFHNTGSNFVGTLATDALADGKTIRNFTHELTAEYQPNRNLSLGGIFRFEQMSLNGIAPVTYGDTGLGDQRIFMEFRFHDQPGVSLGVAGIVKFPLYKNPTADELAATSHPNEIVLFGDGQLDTSLLLCGEYWFTNVVRLRSDLGVNFRSQGYAPDLPYLLAIGFVTPKMDLDLRLKGNVPLGTGSNLVALAPVKTAFGGSDFALSPNARHLILNPSVALWMSPKLSFHFDFEMSLAGNHSANFTGFVFGLGYRWAKTKQDRPRTFQEVDIKKNLDGDRFEAEDALKNGKGPNKEPRYDEEDIIYE